MNWTGGRKVAVGALVALAWAAGLGVMALIAGGSASPAPEASLLDASPSPWSGSPWSGGRYTGYERFTADELRRRPPPSGIAGLRFVGPDRPSTGPTVVSVHPIDHFTWGAAAASTGRDRCVVTVSVAQRDQPQYGGIRYGLLPAGTPCVGNNATTATATLDDLPTDEQSDPLVAVLAGVAIYGAPLALLALVVVRAPRHRLRVLLRNLAIAVASTVAWWVALFAVVSAVGASWHEFGWSNYYGGFCWGLAGGLVVLVAAVSALAPDGASAEARIGFAALGAGVVALPIAFMVSVASVI